MSDVKPSYSSTHWCTYHKHTGAVTTFPGLMELDMFLELIEQQGASPSEFIVMPPGGLEFNNHE